MKNIPIDNTMIFVYDSLLIEVDRHKNIYVFCKLGGTSTDIIVNQIEKYYIVTGDFSNKINVTVKQYEDFEQGYHQFLQLKNKVINNKITDIRNKYCNEVLKKQFDRVVVYKKNNLAKLQLQQIRDQLQSIDINDVTDQKLVKRINQLITLVNNTSCLFENNRDNIIDQRNQFYKCYNKWNSTRSQLKNCNNITINQQLITEINTKFSNIENYQGFN